MVYWTSIFFILALAFYRVLLNVNTPFFYIFMTRISTLICTILVLILFSCNENGKEILRAEIPISVSGGRITGTSDSSGLVKIYKGIPFAAPPLANLRWKAPQPVLPWEGIKTCDTNPAAPMQKAPVPFFSWSEEFLIPKAPISEDCLYLNVWTAAASSTEKRPVLVWIYGGGFSSGSNTVPLYDGEELAKQGIVVVAINYRVGILGFFAHPELSTESLEHTSGNYGLLDQIAGLEWVKNNIAAFGGDPEKVTIAGQSAGAFSVNALVVSPKAKGLFHQVIAQSGGMFNKGSGLISSHKVAEESGKRLTESLGISLGELRKKPADSLLTISGRFGPVVDGIILPNVREAFESKNYADVPLLTGWNADDRVSGNTAILPDEYVANAKKEYGKRADEFLTLFPADNQEVLQKSLHSLGVLAFGLQNYTWAKMQTERGTHPAFVYYFTRVPPGEPNYGAFHSAEISYALHTLRKWNRPFEKIDFDLESKMSTFWVNFVKTGNPNGDLLEYWPIFDTSNPKVLELGNEIKSRTIPFWDQLKFLESLNH